MLRIKVHVTPSSNLILRYPERYLFLLFYSVLNIFSSLFVFVINVLYICYKIDNIMNVTTSKVQTAFRFDKDLIRRLKIKAKKENRSLNNYVETVLMDIVYDEPNIETVAAIEEVRSGKQLDKLDVDNLEGFVAEL